MFVKIKQWRFPKTVQKLGNFNIAVINTTRVGYSILKTALLQLDVFILISAEYQSDTKIIHRDKLRVLANQSSR